MPTDSRDAYMSATAGAQNDGTSRARLPRRTVLGAGAAGALALGLRPQPSWSASSAPPNILLAIADDWGYPFAGAYGFPAARTPTFDRLAAEGALFTRAFAAAPTCTASRNAILTGQAPHRLEDGANLWSRFPAKFTVYPDLFEQAGYRIGKVRKAYGPGTLEGRTQDPAGPDYPSFDEFLQGQSKATPFCFWFGAHDPHRPYRPPLGEESGIDPASVDVPPYLPDTPEIRDDIVDYLAEVQRFDRELGHALELLDQRGLADNTIVVVTGDNGWPWPRGKANVYDAGAHVPLAIRWPGRVSPGTVVDDLTVLTDLAPTFLEVAGLDVPDYMTGQSLLPVLSGEATPREVIVIERERHALARIPNLAYPVRALRTPKWLYIRNYFPERWPAGDPDFSASQGVFSDIDKGPTKTQLLENRYKPGFVKPFHLATNKRGAVELYDTESDPHNLVDLADDGQYSQIKSQLDRQLQDWMRKTGDPRASGPRTEFWDNTEYFGRTDF